MSARAWKWLAAGCAVVFAGGILRDIARHAVDVPFWDQWDYAAALRRIAAGETTWPALLAAGLGEHRVALELLYSAAAWQLTGMRMPALMFCNWGTALLFCWLAARVTRRALPGSTVPWIVFAAACLFVFNPAAYQVWLWGLPLVHLLIPLLLLAGIRAAQGLRSVRAGIFAAAGAAAVASCTLASGLLLWVLFPPVLIGYGTTVRRNRLAWAAYGGLALACGVALLGRPGMAPADGPSGFWVATRFFLAYTGNVTALAPMRLAFAEIAGALLAGFFLLVAGVGLRRFRGSPQWGAYLIWFSLGAYSLLAGALVAAGRHRFGVAYALESRYVLASSFLPVACVALGCMLARDLPVFRWTVLIVVAGLGLRVLQTGPAHTAMEAMQAGQLRGKAALTAVNVAPLADYREIYPHEDRNEFRLTANFLNRRGWLRPPLAASPTR